MKLILANKKVENLIKQLFHSGLLDMRLVRPTRPYGPRWLFTISYPMRAHGIIVKYWLETKVVEKYTRPRETRKRGGAPLESRVLRSLRVSLCFARTGLPLITKLKFP